jgi:hypothetical protein
MRLISIELNSREKDSILFPDLMCSHGYLQLIELLALEPNADI